MVEDIEKQATPLIDMGAKDNGVHNGNSVNVHLDNGNGSIQESQANTVWRSPPVASQAAQVTSLHTAAKNGTLDCLKALLDSASLHKILDHPNHTGKTPLMGAVTEAQPKAAKMLLEAGANINARDDNFRSCLHLLTFNLGNGTKPEETMQIVDLLLSRKDIDLEAHNDSYMTPLAMVAERIQQATKTPPFSGLFTFCERLLAAGASCQEKVGNATIEEVLKQNPHTAELMIKYSSPSPPDRPTFSKWLDMIILNKDIEDVRKFLKKMSPETARYSANCRLGVHTLLFHAVKESHETLVEALLDAGADPWATEISGEIPIYLAVAKGHFVILDQIIKHMKIGDNPANLQEHSYNIFEKLIESSQRNLCKGEEDYLKCLERLLEPDVLLNVNQTLKVGSSETTPLHMAASFNNQKVLSQLLCRGSYLGARRVIIGKDCGHVLEALLPATLMQAMDGCITHHTANGNDKGIENILADDYTLNLNYNFLVPPVDIEPKEEKSEMEILMEISKSKTHRKAIKHPLVQTLLYGKWQKALPFYIFNLLIYLMFVVFLTAFVYKVKDLRVARAEYNVTKGEKNATIEEDISNKQTTVYVLMVFLIPMTIYMAVREIFQFFFSKKMYLKNFENYLEWFLVISVFVLCIPTLDVEATRHLAAWAMIVAWYEFILILGKAPQLAIYITMLGHISRNFLKLIFLYGSLILAFTISFNIILQPALGEEETNFKDFWTTLPKAIVMVMGEIEYNDLSGSFSKDKLVLASTLLVFLLFLFLICLVFMNVMNALAVTDTQQVVDDALLYSLTSRLELVYLIESLLLRIPVMRSHISKVQLLTGSQNTPLLKAEINKEDESKRLLSGKKHDHLSGLDDDTAENLRAHRRQQLEKESQSQKGGQHVCHCSSNL